jgi:hypothetical protein
MAEIISQGKVFIDFGGTPGGSGGGAVWLEYLVSFKATDEGSTEAVKAIGKRRGAGFREKAGGFMLTLTENQQDTPQVNWRQLRKDKKRFMLIVQDENGGSRRKYFPCRVSKVSMTKSDEGEHQDEIEVAALDER